MSHLWLMSKRAYEEYWLSVTGFTAKRLLTAENAEDAEIKDWIQRYFLCETPGFSLRSQRTLR